MNLQSLSLPEIIAAIGGLGTAAFGLVESLKALIPGFNRIGLHTIQSIVSSLTPSVDAQTSSNSMSQEKILATVEANWINGNDLASQKAIAKSLIKLNLNEANARDVAKATGIDAEVLKAVAQNNVKGESLTAPQSDVYGRFDLIVTALLDEAYQRSDQHYRNWMRFWAMIIAILLAVAGGIMLHFPGEDWAPDIARSLLVGILATPLAPIAKDLSTALATAVNTLQLVKKK